MQLSDTREGGCHDGAIRDRLAGRTVFTRFRLDRLTIGRIAPTCEAMPT